MLVHLGLRPYFSARPLGALAFAALPPGKRQRATAARLAIVFIIAIPRLESVVQGRRGSCLLPLLFLYKAAFNFF